MLPEESMMNKILGLAALLDAGVDNNSSTSSAQTGDATVKESNSPAPAQAVRVMDVNMCPYLFMSFRDFIAQSATN